MEDFMVSKLRDYINGSWYEEDGDYLDVMNPSTGGLLAKVPVTPEKRVEEAIDAAAAAFETWKNTSMSKRVEYLFKLHTALADREEELAQVIAADQAKHIKDARGEVARAIQLVETSCALPLLVRGDKIAINEEIDGEIMREPVGVIGSLAPFNFPALVFGWFVPFAVGCGNTLVFKASEQSPMFMQEIAKILEEIGLPKGVFNLVNGAKTVVETMLNSDKIQAMTFVGSTKVGRIIAEGCAKTGKKAMVLAGAKNTLIVAEDANIDAFLENFINSCYGAAGQRCMAGSNVVVAAGIYDKVKESLLKASMEVKVGDATDEAVFMGPVISEDSLKRIHSYIELGIQEGCTLLLDGRRTQLSEKNKNGYFVGPTILEGATADMRVVKEEIFGPVVTLIKANCFREGIKIINASEYGNGGAIFTESGRTAQIFLRETNSGMLGVNVGVPASMPYLPFGGTKGSLLGSQIKAQGTDAVDFFTKRKVATIRFYGKESKTDLPGSSTCCIIK
jgi:malonate-semialdehyde dehydrogenase (acetylating)/methylmalonate-semialdehyde dehydrogenase